MLKSKRYRIIKLLIQLGDVIIDSKLGNRLEGNYRQRKIEQTQKDTNMKGMIKRRLVSGEGYMAWDKGSNTLLEVKTLYSPLNSPSWKDIVVETEDGLEWRGLNEVILMRLVNTDKEFKCDK